jgi:asparagine synthase (glutamine-hydrolysing)
MEYSFALDHGFKYHRGVKKRILKDLAYEFMPKELLDRPKRGFGVPIEKWLRTLLNHRLKEYSRKEVLERQGIFHPSRTEKFIDDVLSAGKAKRGYNFSKTAWSFFVFQQWYSKYIEDIGA